MNQAGPLTDTCRPRPPPRPPPPPPPRLRPPVLTFTDPSSQTSPRARAPPRPSPAPHLAPGEKSLAAAPPVACPRINSLLYSALPGPLANLPTALRLTQCEKYSCSLVGADMGCSPTAVFSAMQCPPSEDGMERFACPTPDRMGRYRCIDDHVLCDGFIDCPTGEDEDRQSCMFYKTTKAHLDVLADALLRWARGR
ncbi:unnamed protein product [Bemisia tabaci]|uniref:Uncharacterized protein n=2 Tax=Bemisia tabaci TaxID=7038 RepID=A0A9P0CCX8_BEMTA|nr:unnamed protein product [Bemisia tabaci]